MNNSNDLPLSDWRSRALHFADECCLEQCEFCGCCVHGQTIKGGCKVETAPSGMRCPNNDCGCEGR